MIDPKRDQINTILSIQAGSLGKVVQVYVYVHVVVDVFVDVDVRE